MEKYDIINSMKELYLRELIKYKKLPFNIYNEKGQILMYTGDLLTPGKLMELKNAMILLYDENFEHKSQKERENPLVVKRRAEKDSSNINNRQYGFSILEEDEEGEKQEITTSNAITRNVPTVETRTQVVTESSVNKTSLFSEDTQNYFKQIYADVIEELENRSYQNALSKVIKVMDTLETEVLKILPEVKCLSQLKLFGDYKICHALNVAIFAGFLSKSLELNMDIRDVILSGLLHDVGKTRISENIAYKQILYIPEQAEYEKHVIIGYKIIKEIFKLGNVIARPALEHHALQDGSGYPKGIDLNSLTEISKLISVCNFVDNLTSNRTVNNIQNCYEAGKLLLSTGTHKYPVEIIYAMSNKYLMNDTTNFNEMLS